MPKKSWYQHEEMSGAIFGIKTLMFLEKFLGEKFIRFLISIVMFFYWCFAVSARQSSKEYLEVLRSYQNDLSFQNTPQVNIPHSTYRHFLSFGNAIFDKLLCWSGKITLKNTVIFQPPSTEDALQFNQDQGKLILGCHLGNIEIARALAELETSQKIHILMQTNQSQKFNSILKSLNNRSQINIINISDITPETMIYLKSVLDAGDLVTILADRLPASDTNNAPLKSTEITFLGKTTLFPSGPFILALLLNVPTYFMVGLKNQNQYEIHLEKLHLPHEIKRHERTKNIHDLTRQYANHLTKYCLKAPLQWFNFYDFWSPPTKDRSQ